MVELNWTIGAIDDLGIIAEYIGRDSLKYARIQVRKIRNKTHLLRTMPYAGKKVPELDDDTIRELLEGRYRIIYKIVSEERIDILTVHHSSRLLSNNPNL